MSAAAAAAAGGRVAGTLDYSGFGSVDMVIEAVIEDLKLKQAIFTGASIYLARGLPIYLIREFGYVHMHSPQGVLMHAIIPALITFPHTPSAALPPSPCPRSPPPPPPLLSTDLEKACRPDAILSSNTSTIDIELIGARTGAGDRMVGAHFFSPAHVMPLLEIVRTRQTSKQVTRGRVGRVMVWVGGAGGMGWRFGKWERRFEGGSSGDCCVRRAFCLAWKLKFSSSNWS